MARYALAVAIALSLAAPAGAEKYDLAKLPPVKVGAQMSVTSQEQSQVVVTVGEGQVAVQSGEIARMVTRCEVLAVDDAGRPTQVRMTIVNEREIAKAQKPNAAQATSTLFDVTGTATRDGSRFKVDTTTLASGKMTELSAPQVRQLKDHINDGITLPGYPEDKLALMPPAPVAVGESWTVPREKLQQWLDRTGSTKIEATAESATLKLDSVTDGQAAVSGVINATALVNGLQMKMVMNVGCTINLATGLWVDNTLSATAVGSQQGMNVQVTGKEAQSLTYQPGNGQASPPRENLNAIGWMPAGEDTNSYRNPAHGFSIDVPEGSQPQKPPESLVVQFILPQALSIGVSSTDAPVPLTVPDFAKALSQSLAADGITVHASQPVTLAGNVPGMLLDATMNEGKVTLAMLFAIDGTRVVTATVGAATANAERVAQARKVATTLRVFDESADGE